MVRLFGARTFTALAFLIAMTVAVSSVFAETVTMRSGLNLMGAPGLSVADFSSCNLQHLNSSFDHKCQYSMNGPLVFFDTNPSAGGQTDCGSSYRSASTMHQGLGYFVRTSNACDVTFNQPSIVDVTLVKGLNVISVPVRTTIDDISRFCGDKTKIIGYFNSSSNTSCRYDRYGYFIRYDSSMNNGGDCKSNYVSDDALESFMGYFVRFMGRNGDGVSPCTLRYQDGELVAPPISTTTYASSTSTTLRSTTVSSSTTTARSSTTAATSSPTTSTSITIDPSKTFYVNVTGSTFYATNPSKAVLYSGTSAASALQAAFNAVGSGQTIYIKGGTYPISTQIHGSRAGVTITGDKTAIIKASATMGYMFLWTGDSFTLKNIVFDGGRTTAWPDTGASGYSAGPAIQHCSHVIVDGITVQNTRRTPPVPPAPVQKGVDGLILQGASGSLVTDYEIKNSRFSNIWGSGIAAAYITHLNIHDNTFVDCAQWYPIGGAAYVGDVVSYIDITRNDVSGHTDNDGFYVGTSSNFATNVLIAHNDIDIQLYAKGGGDSHPENPGGYAGSGIKIYGSGGEITGNTVNWNNAHYNGWPVYVYGIEDWGAGVNIHDNTVSNAKVGIGTMAVSGKPTGNNIIRNNRITGCITPIDDSGGNTVSGNIIS
jgi:hypothetical protein